MMAAGALFAQRANRIAPNRRPMEMHRFAGPMQACMDELKLSDAQQKKFAESRAAFQKQENTLKAEISNLKLDMVAAMKAENPKRVKELNKQISDKELLLENAHVDLMSNYMKELNKEQKEIMLKHMPMMMRNGLQNRFDARGAIHGKMMQRRAPGMGVRQHDCEEECEDCDGDRKFKHRK